jgi:hypothetical protein
MHVRQTITAFVAAVTISASGYAAPRASAKPRPDLADVAQGTYHGDVISDSRGESRSGVTITVTKTGPSTVRVTSDYRRLPAFTARLERVMNTIQKTGGPEVFLLDLGKSPAGLDVTVDEASWSGSKAPRP